MSTRFTIQAIFQAIDRMTAPITRMRQSVRGLGNEMEKTEKKSAAKKDPFSQKWERASQAFGRIDNRIRNIGQTALIAGTTAGYGFANLVTAGSDLEFSLVSATSKLEDMSGRGSNSYDILREAALRYGETSMFSAQEVADSFNNLAQAGFDRNSMLALTPRLINFAVAAETDLANASMIAGNAMGQFGLLYDSAGKLLSGDQLASNMQRVSDVMAKTANMSNASIEQVYETMTESGAIARISGISLEKYSAMLAVLAQSGINASVAGTGLKNILVRLKNPTSEGAKALAQYGIDLEKFTDIKDPMQQFQALIGALEGQSDKKKQGFLDEYFGKIPLAAAATLFSGGAQLVENFHQGMLSSAGTTEIIAARLMDTTKAKMKTAFGVFKTIGAEMFGSVQFPVEKALKGISEWAKENKPMIVNTFREMVLGARDWGVWIYQNRDTLLSLAKAFIALKVGNAVVGTLVDSFKILTMFATPITSVINLISLAQSGTMGWYAAIAQVSLALKAIAAIGVIGVTLAITKYVMDREEAIREDTGGTFGVKDFGAERLAMSKELGRYVKKEEVMARLKEKAKAFKANDASTLAGAADAVSDRFFQGYMPGVGADALADLDSYNANQLANRNPFLNNLPLTPNTNDQSNAPVINHVITNEKAFAEVRITTDKGTNAFVETTVGGLIVTPKSGDL